MEKCYENNLCTFGINNVARLACYENNLCIFEINKLAGVACYENNLCIFGINNLARSEVKTTIVMLNLYQLRNNIFAVPIISNIR